MAANNNTGLAAAPPGKGRYGERSARYRPIATACARHGAAQRSRRGLRVELAPRALPRAAP
eukprot:3223519-Lingulodinium_polyedra.AAC.1